MFHLKASHAAILAWISVGMFAAGSGCSMKPEAVESKQPGGPNAAARYERQLVRRAGSTPEDEKVYVVEYGKRRWIVNSDWIRQHGYKWPEDVRMIRSAELDAIPLGEPIQ